MTIKNIIFDVGNVFIFWNPYSLFKKYFKDKEEIDAFFKEISFHEMNLATDKGLPFKTAVDNAIKKFPHHKEALLAYDSEWPASLVGEVEGTVPLMLSLKKAGYNVYGLSNFSKEKFEVCIKTYKFAEHFDGLVLSADVCEAKPEPAIYKILLKKYNLKPEECVFLDDRQENLDTATSLGFKTILFSTAEKAAQELKALGVKF